MELCTKYFFWLEKDYFLAFLLEYFVILMPDYICYFIKGEQIRPVIKQTEYYLSCMLMFKIDDTSLSKVDSITRKKISFIMDFVDTYNL